MHKCIGCKRTFEHLTGLSNHQRRCAKWKDYDLVTVAIHKKRRLEQLERTQAENDARNIILDDNLSGLEMPGPAQEEDSTLEVRTDLLFHDLY
jgi:hypothetical protein